MTARELGRSEVYGLCGGHLDRRCSKSVCCSEFHEFLSWFIATGAITAMSCHLLAFALGASLMSVTPLTGLFCFRNATSPLCCLGGVFFFFPFFWLPCMGAFNLIFSAFGNLVLFWLLVDRGVLDCFFPG